METAISPLTKAEQALAQARTPAESKRVEALAAAARAWAKENDDYEGVVIAGKIYIFARRKTTELIQPNIKHGGDHTSEKWEQGDTIVTLLDFGFDKKQWSRRIKELEVPEKVIDSYFDDCIEKNIEPTRSGMMRFAYGINFTDETYEWFTPKQYIEAARQVMGGIDLDPASSETANKVVKATTFYTEDDDGLTKPWYGKVWLNPPYNMPVIQDFIQKTLLEYTEGNVESAIVLTNNATDTGWFHSLVDYPVCFTKGRIHFWNEAGDELATRNGQVFSYLGNDEDLFAEVFSTFGAVLCRYANK